MGVGHAAVALAATKAYPRLNVGWLVFAAFLADFLLGIFVMVVGRESVHIPADYAARHYLTFTFPYSHGLLLLLFWATLLGLVVCWIHGEESKLVFLVVAALVLSHFILDGLVHVVGLPLAGEGSQELGLGLWNHVILELTLETLMAVVGIVMYLRVSVNSLSWTRWGVLLLMALVTVITSGQLFRNQPPAPSQLAVGWIVLPLVLSGAMYALDRQRASNFEAA